MKTITKRMYNLLPGTIIYRAGGDIVTITCFDSFHGWYETDGDSCLTPADIIGDKYDDDNAAPEAEFSMDNGHKFYEADMIEEMDEDEANDVDRLWGAIVGMMEDDIRESVHEDLAPCTNLEFLAEYLRRARHNLVVG